MTSVTVQCLHIVSASSNAHPHTSPRSCGWASGIAGSIALQRGARRAAAARCAVFMCGVGVCSFHGGVGVCSFHGGDGVCVLSRQATLILHRQCRALLRAALESEPPESSEGKQPRQETGSTRSGEHVTLRLLTRGPRRSLLLEHTVFGAKSPMRAGTAHTLSHCGGHGRTESAPQVV